MHQQHQQSINHQPTSAGDQAGRTKADDSNSTTTLSRISQ